MARALTDIIQGIITSRQSKPQLAGLNGPRAASDYGLWEDAVGYCHYQVELECDDLKAELDQEIANNHPGTRAWWGEKITEFQYDAAEPQVIEEIDFIAQYPVIDETKRIIARRSVRNVAKNGHLVVSVKVAKLVNDVYMPLSEDEMTALNDYTLAIRPAGISMEIVSLFADRLKVVADIYFQGQYSEALVKTNVKQAIDDYAAILSSSNDQFDGLVRLSLLEDYIQKVPGVTDVVLHQVYGRDQASPVVNGVLIDRVYYTQAGYIIPEDTTGHTLDDTLTFIAETN